LGESFYSLNEDCRWHRAWNQALTWMVVEENARNSRTIQAWIEKRHPSAVHALQAFAPVFEEKLEAAQVPPIEGVAQQVDKYYRAFLSSIGLQPPGFATLHF
jgi:hypothetical protein